MVKLRSRKNEGIKIARDGEFNELRLSRAFLCEESYWTSLLFYVVVVSFLRRVENIHARLFLYIFRVLLKILEWAMIISTVREKNMIRLCFFFCYFWSLLIHVQISLYTMTKLNCHAKISSFIFCWMKEMQN